MYNPSEPTPTKKVTKVVRKLSTRPMTRSRCPNEEEGTAGTTLALRNARPANATIPMAETKPMVALQPSCLATPNPTGTPTTVPTAKPASTIDSARPRYFAGTDIPATAEDSGE